MITDIEFQNRRDVMRLAPWLDMPLLRTRLRDILRAQLESNRGFLGGYVKTYREDMQSFCDGERDRMPRCSSAVEFLRMKVPGIFPAAVADTKLGEAIELICTHIMQIGMWRSHERGAEPQDTPGETPHRENPLLEGPQDYEDEDYDERMDSEEF